MRAEVLRVHLIHLREIGHVRQIHRRLHDLAERRSRRGQDGFQIGEHLLRLLRRRPAYKVAAFGIERDLSRGEHEAVGRDRLTVGANGFGGGVGGNDTHQNSPSIVPSGRSRIRSAAGFLPRPGIVMMSPANATTNPAPAEGRTSRTCSVNPVGAPSCVASSENDYCFLAMHTGVSPSPSFGISSSARSATGANPTPAAP